MTKYDRTHMMITSLHNPKIKKAIALRERRERDQTNTFLIEGYRELLRAVDSGQDIHCLFICPSFFLGSNEPSLIERIQGLGADIIICNDAVFQKISYRDRPDGLLAIAPQKRSSFHHLDKILSHTETPLFLVAEAIEKPGNLGTILRSSDAVGLDALIICDKCTDIYNPNVIRASVGTLFTVPVIEAGSDDTLAWLKYNQIKILAATPSAKFEFTEVDLTSPLTIAVGTEQLGLSKKWMDQADLHVKIPMHGIADSLNVAQATTLLLYEALRQRKQKPNPT